MDTNSINILTNSPSSYFLLWRWIIPSTNQVAELSNPTALIIFGLTTTLISQFARPPCPLQGTWRNVRRSRTRLINPTQMPTHLLPARSCSIIRIQCLTNRDHVKLNVVTVKGSHRALLWVFSVSGKYNRIFPRYPDHRCPVAACTNTSKAARNCNGDARETSGIDFS